MTLEIRINDLPKLPNQIRMSHWRIKQKETKKWWDLIHLHTYSWANSHETLESVRIEYERHASRAPDYDNLVASFKPVTDALIKCGVILDDNPSIVKESEYRFVKTARKDSHICLKITKI